MRYGSNVSLASNGAANDGQSVSVWLDVTWPGTVDTSTADAFASGLMTRIEEGYYCTYRDSPTACY